MDSSISPEPINSFLLIGILITEKYFKKILKANY